MKHGFRLEVLLKLRERRADACLVQFAAVRQRQGVLDARWNEVQRTSRDVDDRQRQLGRAGTVSVPRLVETRTAREGLKLTRSELRRKQQLVEELVELARGSLEQSRKDVQVLQRLRERRLGPHLAPS